MSTLFRASQGRNLSLFSFTCYSHWLFLLEKNPRKRCKDSFTHLLSLCWVFIAVHGLSNPVACGTSISWPGIEPVFSALLQDKFLTTGPPGKSHSCLFSSPLPLSGKRSLLLHPHTSKPWTESLSSPKMQMSFTGRERGRESRSDCYS